MEAGLIPYPHTETSFEIRSTMWGFLIETFDVIIDNLRSEIVGYRRIRIEALHRVILYRGFHQRWQSVSDIQRFYDGWVREHYAHFFSTARHSQEQNDRSNLVFSDPVSAEQSTSAHRTLSDILETSPIIHPHTPTNFEFQQSIWASLTAIFDIIENLHSVFEHDPDSRIERIRRAILANGTRRYWDSVTDMCRFYEGYIQERYPHLFSRIRTADDDPERQTLYDRNQGHLFRIDELMGKDRPSWSTEDSDASTPQEERNDSDTPLRTPREIPSVIPISLVRPARDSGTFSSGEGGGGRGGRGGQGGHNRYLISGTSTSVGGHAEPQYSAPSIIDFATPNHPSFHASFPLRSPPSVPRQRRTFPRRRRARQPPPDAPTRQEISAYNREMRLRGAPVPPRVRRVSRPSWWIPHVETGVLRRDEETRVAGATGQGQIDTIETLFGRECGEIFSLPLFVKC